MNNRSLYDDVVVKRSDDHEPASLITPAIAREKPQESGLAAGHVKRLENGARAAVERKVQFIFAGFTQDTGFRVFAFERVAGDRTRTAFTVRTDLALVRRYGIRVQELPLLCRALLEQRNEGDGEHTVTFTEEGMRLHADSRAAERDAAQRRKSPHKPPSTPAGTGWRIPQQR